MMTPENDAARKMLGEWASWLGGYLNWGDPESDMQRAIADAYYGLSWLAQPAEVKIEVRARPPYTGRPRHE